ncbi:MAG: hypothetical protein IK086_06775, partial [Clostridia bacterium]|nr:hypothetical protein [Clostridia bacterium]
APAQPVYNPVQPAYYPAQPTGQPVPQQGGFGGEVKPQKAKTKWFKNPVILIVAAVVLIALIIGGIFGTKAIIRNNKYNYVKDNFNRNDEKTQEYLTELKGEGYKDSAELYDELFGWHVSFVYLNTDEEDTKTVDEVISKHCKYLHYDFVVSGGLPGEKLKLAMKTTNPDGSDDTYKFDYKLKDGDVDGFYYDDGLDGWCDSGKMTLEFINLKTDKTIETLEIKIADDYIWKLAFRYFNTDKNDKKTIAKSVSKYADYSHYGYYLWGGPSGKKLNIKIVKTFPNGDTDEYDYSKSSDNEYEIYSEGYAVRQPDTVPNGTLKIEAFNADTNELLDVMNIEITDEVLAEPVFEGKVEMTNCNYDENDRTTKLTSIERKGRYLRVGYKLIANDGKAEGNVNIRRVEIRPDGSVYSTVSTYDLSTPGYFLSFGTADKGYDFKEAGNLTIKFYDAVSNTLIGTISVEVK